MVLQLLISLLKSPSYNKYKACSKSVRVFNYECEEYSHDISAAMFTYSLSPVVKVFHEGLSLSFSPSSRFLLCSTFPVVGEAERVSSILAFLLPPPLKSVSVVI